MRAPTPDDPRDIPRTWDRVHALFHEALELEPAARDALLRQTAERDPKLAAEVRSLIASHEEAGEFLDTPAIERLPAAVAPGDRLGPYRILEEIGRGGMGVVFRAIRDDEHFSKEVAIKLIDPGMRSEGLLKRFRAERQILAMLEHPHIARLIDGGASPDGSPYLVMEHVSGKPLVEYCDEHRLGVDGRLRLFLTVCDAVQFAHQRLVVHRDLKSDNILVTEDGSPRLLDFGIAKLISHDPGEVVGTVTAPMHRMLTPDYASPEQVRGDPVTAASDVYSLGVVLYELMTGTRPLHFETRTPEEILRVITQQEPALPSSAVARSHSVETASLRGATVPRLRRRLAGDLDYIILKALEKDPARRYGSVDQLSRDIRRFLDNLPVLARGRTTAYLLSRLVRRHRVAVVTGGLVAISLVAGLVGTAWQAHVASLERDRAKRRFEDVRGLAHAVVFDIHDAIANLPGSTKARETLVMHALRYLDNLSREAADDPILQRELGVAYGKIGDVQGRPEFSNLGRTSDALRSYTRSMELLGAASKARPDSMYFARDLVLTMQRLADLLGRMGKQDEAMKLALDAKGRIIAERVRYPDEELLQGDFGVATDRLSDMRFAAGDTLGAIREATEGTAVVEQLYLKDPSEPQRRRSIMVAYAKMAPLLAMSGDRDGAAGRYRRAEELALECVAALPNNNDAMRDLGVVYSMRATFLADGGEIDSALILYGRSMRISEELGAADPSDVLQQADVANGHLSMGSILVKGNRYREAEERFGEAYQRFSRLASNDTANVDAKAQMARASRNAGDACRAIASGSVVDRRRWRLKAVDWYQKSLRIYRALGDAGALAGGEAGAPAEVSRDLAAIAQAE
jgi:eukaryotic-like serine/threonine-protein kinase